jgi:nitroreductase
MTQKTKELSVIEVMKERKTVRKYEKGYVMPEQDLRDILEAAIEAPSAWNLQHWKFLVIKEEENKQKLLPIAYFQEQIVDSSVTIAVLGDLEANKNGEVIYGEAAAKGFMSEEAKNTLLGQIDGAYKDPQFARDAAILNASLAAMQLMLAAKAKGYDTCAMGGFNPEQLIEAFNIPARYIPVMLITVGKAAKPAHQTGRLPLEQVVVSETF